jgi:hypothetical protein
MTKRLVLALLFGMAAMLFSSCDSGNRGNAPIAVRGIPADKNTATLVVQLHGFGFGLFARNGGDVVANIVANATALGEIKVNLRDNKPGLPSTGDATRSFTFAPLSGENLIELIGPSKDTRDKVAQRCRIGPGEVLVISAFCVPSQLPGPGEVRYITNPQKVPDSPLDKAALNAQNYGPPFVGINAAFLSRIVLDKTPKYVITKEEAVRRPVGGPKVLSVEKAVERSVRVQFKQKGEAEGHSKAFWGWGWAEARIRGEVEQSQDKTDKECEKMRVEITVPGDGKRYQVAWRDVYRTGRIEMTLVIDGLKQGVPFEYYEGQDIDSTPIED